MQSASSSAPVAILILWDGLLRPAPRMCAGLAGPRIHGHTYASSDGSHGRHRIGEVRPRGGRHSRSSAAVWQT